MFWDKDGIMLMIVLLIVAPYIVVACSEWIWHYARRGKQIEDASHKLCADR